MKSFSNNRELYEYLLFLTAELKKRKFDELSEAVAFASHQASGMSTEFLGESRIALRWVLKEEDGILTVEERADMSDVLKQLDAALDRKVNFFSGCRTLRNRRADGNRFRTTFQPCRNFPLRDPVPSRCLRNERAGSAPARDRSAPGQSESARGVVPPSLGATVDRLPAASSFNSLRRVTRRRLTLQ